MGTGSKPARLQCCPKCGGTNGYEGVLVMRYQMTGAWGQAWETSGAEKADYRSPSVKCADCGHRVPTGIAEGYETPNVRGEPTPMAPQTLNTEQLPAAVGGRLDRGVGPHGHGA